VTSTERLNIELLLPSLDFRVPMKGTPTGDLYDLSNSIPHLRRRVLVSSSSKEITAGGHISLSRFQE
jgi:hypothetical protein